MSLLPAKQINAVFGGYVRANNFNANGASNAITAALTTALGNAGRGGVSVPVQVSASEDGIGIVTAAAYNRVEIYENASKQKLSDGSGNEIYARITEAAGVYTLTYYSLVAGVETAYTAFANKAIDFEFIYRYSFATLPAEAFVGINSRNVNEDPTGAAARTYHERLAPTGTNTLPNLFYTPDQNYNISLIVNGQVINTQDSPTPFTVAGKVITWNAANAGFSIATTDNVIARYTTLN